jgi:hypothetical protein
MSSRLLFTSFGKVTITLESFSTRMKALSDAYLQKHGGDG